MLTSEGHIQVIGFGMSAEGMDDHYATTRSFSGTAEFLAPEVCFHNNRSRLPRLGDLMGSTDSIG